VLRYFFPLPPKSAPPPPLPLGVFPRTLSPKTPPCFSPITPLDTLSDFCILPFKDELFVPGYCHFPPFANHINQKTPLFYCPASKPNLSPDPLLHFPINKIGLSGLKTLPPSEVLGFFFFLSFRNFPPCCNSCQRPRRLMWHLMDCPLVLVIGCFGILFFPKVLKHPVATVHGPIPFPPNFGVKPCPGQPQCLRSLPGVSTQAF